MEKRDLTCIGCPLGCQITVTMENGEQIVVSRMYADELRKRLGIK